MIYIWKEWKEQSRGVGLWLSLGVSMVTSLVILLQSLSFPVEQGLEVLLLSLYEMNLYLLPLLCLFLSSFSIMAEKEQKTLMILLSKKESYRRFLLKKSIAVHVVLAGVFLAWFFLLALPMKLLLPFRINIFLAFLLASSVLLVIFNQLGLFLGSVARTRLQLVGLVILLWFFLLYFIDLAFLYMLPAVTRGTIHLFSILYFLNPLHTIRFYLETSFQLLSLKHLSRLVQQMVWTSPVNYLILNIIIWTVIPFELAVRFHVKGER